MKSQISRDSYQSERHYSGVYLQQGRMILDADWNELGDIQKQALVAALRDAISGTNVAGGALAGGAPRVGGLGLVNVAASGNPPDIRIQPGVLYVEGVRARLDATAPVQVTAQADYPIQASYPALSLRLYADVWDRCVTALQDTAPLAGDPLHALRRSPLMDAALHGADTASRSQTMLQVKWCADSIDPLDPAQNPTIGNAPLTVKLNTVIGGGDACDPCASQVKADARTGNYLFRVEVHDYNPTSKWLTLKWSRDNGAEACAVAAKPDGFESGPWLWEYFDDVTERLLGNHFAANPAKLRGLIKKDFGTPVDANEPKDYVRQWDGAIRIKLDTGQLDTATNFPSQDRKVALQTGSPTSASWVNFTAGVLKINLEHLSLSLATQARAFVPGDYWLAPVREAADKSGDTVLDAQPPRGIRHHYLYLGSLRADKTLLPEDDAFHRRMAFPPLTDVEAGDVGFTDPCSNLFAGAKNVQQALAALCNIDASDIAYPLPGCPGNTIAQLLKASFDPNNDSKLTVKDALDTLLCKLDAEHLPYTVPACVGAESVGKELGLVAAAGTTVGATLTQLLCQLNADKLPLDKTDTTLCVELQAPSVVTVQDALRALCMKPAGGCTIPVGDSEHLNNLLKHFALSTELTDLWLCIKAGDYVLAPLPPIRNKKCLRLSGESATTVTIKVRDPKLEFGADEVILENLSFGFADPAGQLAITAKESRTTYCRFNRNGDQPDSPAMLSLANPGSYFCQMHWHGNWLQATRRTQTNNDSPVLSLDVIDEVKYRKPLQVLNHKKTFETTGNYDAAVNKAAESIVGMPKAARVIWSNALLENSAQAATIEQRTAALDLAETLKKETLSSVDAAKIVKVIPGVFFIIIPDWALRLETAKVGGSINDNQISGYLLLGNGVAGYHVPAAPVTGRSASKPKIIGNGQELHLEHNQLSSLRANVAPAAIVSGKLATNVNGYSRIFLSHNNLWVNEHSVVSASFVGIGNTWNDPYESDFLGSVIAERASFNANILDNAPENTRLASTVLPTLLASIHNIGIEISAATP